MRNINLIKEKNYFDRETHYTINNDTPEKRFRKGTKLEHIHWKDLKLLACDLLFLTYYLDVTIVKDIIYIGSGSGDHLGILSKLFPEVHFHIFDTSVICEDLYSSSNITIHDHYFEQNDVLIWRSKTCILISNIRNTDYDSSKTHVKDLKANEGMARKDMELQKKWVEEIKPEYSLLRFRLPYAEYFELEKGNTRNYLDGITYIEPFSKPSSIETRLCVMKDQFFSKDWDIISYERKLFHHNSETRYSVFKNPIDEDEPHIYTEIGLYDDFDSTYFTHTVIDYMKKIGLETTKRNIKNTLKYILDNIKTDTFLKDMR